MSAYLFVHFREKSTPDGEQIYFALSQDGYNWEAINDGAPVLWCYYGTRGVRDCTIIRSQLNGKFYILGTDLSISYGTRQILHSFWEIIGKNGSTCLGIWESEDLIHWTEQRLINMGEEFGCVWAPDIIFDKKEQDYILHWSSSLKADPAHKKTIWYSRTKDFEHFTKAEILFEEEEEMIDSAMYEDKGRFHLFVKHAANGGQVALFQSDYITGPFVRNTNFDQSMKSIQANLYEAATAVKLENGQWSLYLDFYGARGAEQGYVPFISKDIEEGFFTRADGVFSFPYRFKHGTILKITDEEYSRMKNHDWSDKGYGPGTFD